MLPGGLSVFRAGMGGSLDMVRDILKEEGFVGLFAGNPLYRIQTLTLITLTTLAIAVLLKRLVTLTDGSISGTDTVG